MWSARVAQMFAELVGAKLKVRTSPCSQILKSTNTFLKLAAKNRIRCGWVVLGEHESTCFHGSGAWIAMLHIKTFKKLEGQGLLREMHVVGVARDVNAHIQANRAIVRACKVREERSLELNSCITGRERKKDVIYMVDEMHMSGAISPCMHGRQAVDWNKAITW
jgi:hypothetical protein